MRLAIILLAAMLLFTGCEITRKSRAIKKIERLQKRQKQIAEKWDISSIDTVWYRDTIIIGGEKTDTVVYWSYKTDTIQNPPNSIIKWRIIREQGDTVLVPYSVQIECPTDTIKINVALPCPNVSISPWERF